MVRAIRERAIVGPAGRVVIDHSDLPEGSCAEVIAVVEEQPAAPGPRSLSSYVGVLRGQFSTAADADAFIRELRDEWDPA